MFKAKIRAGCWKDATIELSGMPEDFTLSARPLCILEEKEYEQLISTGCLGFMDNPELQKAAEKAAATGSQKDLHEYLKLRRNFI